MSTKSRQLLLSVAMLFTLPCVLAAHDYWFKPETFFTAANTSVKVRLFVGDEFKIEEERVLQKEKTDSFQMFSAAQTQDMLAAGQEGQTPAAVVKVGAEGNYLIAMNRKASFIELKAAKFKSYLAEEGLEEIIAERERRGESNMDGRERYSRCLKSLLQVGERHDDIYKRALGQRLEIIPQSNPYQLQRGDSLKVRVTFEGKPLSAGAKVFAYNRDGEAISEQSQRIAGDGMATFKIDKAGEWLVRLVYMRRCGKCTDADWESFWGAYSFGMK